MTGVASRSGRSGPRRQRRPRRDKLALVHRPCLPEPARQPRNASCSGRTTTASSSSPSATHERRAVATQTPRTRRRRSTGRPCGSQDDAARHPARAPEPVQVQRVDRRTARVRRCSCPISDVTRQCISAMLLYFDRAARRTTSSTRASAATRWRVASLGTGCGPSTPSTCGLRALADGRHERCRAGADDPEPHARYAGARPRRLPVLRRERARHHGRRALLARHGRQGARAARSASPSTRCPTMLPWGRARRSRSASPGCSRGRARRSSRTWTPPSTTSSTCAGDRRASSPTPRAPSRGDRVR